MRTVDSRTQKIIPRLKAHDLSPEPKTLMERFVKDRASSGAVFGFIHGSMVSSTDGALCKAYKEVRVHDPEDESVVGLEFEVKDQPPDIDIVMVVSSRKAFEQYFEQLAKELNLQETLNYFLTLNVLTSDVLDQELRDAQPRALRRILLYKPTWLFGDKIAFENAKSLAKRHESELDAKFQREFEDRKLFLKGHLLSGSGSFTIAPSDYQELFPLFFSHLTSDAGGFPEARDKYVLPHSMDLKAKKYAGNADEEQLR